MHVLEEAWGVLKREFESACSQRANAARCQVTNELNQLFRRLRQYKGESEWVSVLLDSASQFVERAAVFEVSDGNLILRGESKMDLPAGLSFPLSSAAAFVSAVETKDPVVALRSPSEVSPSLSRPGSEDRVHLFPVVNGARVVAILFAADQEHADVNGLELIAGLASAVLERGHKQQQLSQIANPVEVVPAPPTGQTASSGQPVRSVPSGLPPWAELSEEHRNLHVRAQRFSRVTVANMQLERPEACQAGRERGDFYLFLKNEIERARDSYRQQFMVIPTMVDYLHLELIRTAVEGDEKKLGSEYPGQMV
jgi:hypothetical protein